MSSFDEKNGAEDIPLPITEMEATVETEEFLPLSGLQHLLFCERQCALIHVEGLWEENRLTVEGRQLHEQVDEPFLEQRPGVRIVRSLPLVSVEMRLVGKADVVEFHREDGPDGKTSWRPFPIEYKRGRRRRWEHTEVQLCAQAMSLEEMMGVAVPRGAVYYGASRRRLPVEFDEDLRRRTGEAARRYHEMVDNRQTPPAVLERKCRSCSLQDLCLPEVTGAPSSASRYLARALEESLKE